MTTKNFKIFSSAFSTASDVSLFVGIARDERRHCLGCGDFWVRNIPGVDQK